MAWWKTYRPTSGKRHRCLGIGDGLTGAMAAVVVFGRPYLSRCSWESLSDGLSPRKKKRSREPFNAGDWFSITAGCTVGSTSCAESNHTSWLRPIQLPPHLQLSFLTQMCIWRQQLNTGAEVSALYSTRWLRTKRVTIMFSIYKFNRGLLRLFKNIFFGEMLLHRYYSSK